MEATILHLKSQNWKFCKIAYLEWLQKRMKRSKKTKNGGWSFFFYLFIYLFIYLFWYFVWNNLWKDFESLMRAWVDEITVMAPEKLIWLERCELPVLPFWIFMWLMYGYTCRWNQVTCHGRGWDICVLSGGSRGWGWLVAHKPIAVHKFGNPNNLHFGLLICVTNIQSLLYAFADKINK